MIKVTIETNKGVYVGFEDEESIDVVEYKIVNSIKKKGYYVLKTGDFDMILTKHFLLSKAKIFLYDENEEA